MFRFTIRDVLWLTVVVAMALGWWVSFPSIPSESPVSGFIQVNGVPLASGRICLQSKEGQIIGARVAKGEFQIPRVPVGSFQAFINGDNVPSKYAADDSFLSVEVRNGTNRIDFELKGEK